VACQAGDKPLPYEKIEAVGNAQPRRHAIARPLVGQPTIREDENDIESIGAAAGYFADASAFPDATSRANCSSTAPNNSFATLRLIGLFTQWWLINTWPRVRICNCVRFPPWRNTRTM